MNIWILNICSRAGTQISTDFYDFSDFFFHQLTDFFFFISLPHYTFWNVYIQPHVQWIHSLLLFCLFSKLYLVIAEHLAAEAQKTKSIFGSRSIPRSIPISIPEVYPEVYPEAFHATEGPQEDPWSEYTIQNVINIIN